MGHDEMKLPNDPKHDFFPFGEIAPLVDPNEFKTWILRDESDFLVVNKPGWLVCHPAKNGPRSSLLGAARHFTGLDQIHLVTRLDRETSGIVIFAKKPSLAGKLGVALEKRRVRKYYVAVLQGELRGDVTVDQPIRRRGYGPVVVRCIVRDDEKSRTAITRFKPVASCNGLTLCKIEPKTGRTHQIRVHANWLGHPIVGDKIYGPDENLFLEFIQRGWTPRLADQLLLVRQALHCYRYEFQFQNHSDVFVAPLPADIGEFCEQQMNIPRNSILK